MRCFGFDLQVAQDLGHDFATSTCGHRLLHEVARLIDKQSVPPEHIHVFGLSDKVRLMRQYNRGQPTGIREGDQSTLARHVAGEVPNQSKEGRVSLRGGERNPL